MLGKTTRNRMKLLSKAAHQLLIAPWIAARRASAPTESLLS